MAEQNSLARKISKLYRMEVFSNFVPNYKDLASVLKFLTIEHLLNLRFYWKMNLWDKMSSEKLEEKMVPMDNIVYKSFVKRFNRRIWK